jgi:hydrogenase maturation protease
MSRSPRVVIGVGNEWRGDDAAGLLVVRRLRALAPGGTRVVEEQGEPVTLIDEWSGSEEAIVVDAVSSGAACGTIHRLAATDRRLPAELFRGSTHAFGVAEAVELARALNRLPRRLVVLGIEGGRFAAGAGLSPQVERAIERLVAELGTTYSGRRKNTDGAPAGPT